MKELFGRPLSLFKSLKLTLGNDWQWWLVPTHPVLKINYFEKLYTIKQIEKLDTFEEDDSDPDKKQFAKEMKRSQIEKQILYIILLLVGVASVLQAKYQVSIWE